MPVAAAVATVVSGAMASRASKKAGQQAADAQKDAIAANAYQGEIATDQYKNYKETYQPLEKSLVESVKGLDSDAAFDTAASEAQAAVGSQLGQAKERLMRTPGFDPSSAAGQAALASMELRGAALGAVEQNKARKAVKDSAFAKKLDVAGMGKGLVSNATAGLASAASTSARIADAAGARATETAAGVGSALGTIANKIDWQGVGTQLGFGSSSTTASSTTS